MSIQPIACWCEEDVPPFSCLFMKSVLNPVASEDPIMIVMRGSRAIGLPSTPMDVGFMPPFGVLNWNWSADWGYFSSNAVQYLLRSGLVTNGAVSVPAKTPFYCEYLMLGVHWLGYDDTEEYDTWQATSGPHRPKANPEHIWFYPRDDTFLLGSVNGSYPFFRVNSLDPNSGALSESQSNRIVDGVLFRRVGHADEARKCVSVVMESLMVQALGN